jgi:hypothetical protein
VAAPVPLANNPAHKGPAFQIAKLELQEQDFYYYMCADDAGLSCPRAVLAWHVKCATIGNLVVEVEKVMSRMMWL